MEHELASQQYYDKTDLNKLPHQFHERSSLSPTEYSNVEINDDGNLKQDKHNLVRNDQCIQANYGNSYVCCFYRKGPLLSLGPEWKLFMVAFLLLGAIGFLVSEFVVRQHSDLMWMVTLCSTAIQLVLFGLTALINPGIVVQETALIQKECGMNYCEICRIKKNSEIYHCFICNVCVKGYDHHCPWVGKCIGERNYLVFRLFKYHTLIFFIYLFIVTLYYETRS